MRDRNIFTQPKISSSVRKTFGDIKRENYEMSRDLRRKIDVPEHISDRLCKKAHLIRKPNNNRNNSQGDLSDYTYSTSSSLNCCITLCCYKDKMQ